jgi:hypothetical protein
LLTASLANSVWAGDQWTTIKGQVVFDGEPPTPQEINVTADQAHCLEKGKLVSETWIVNKSSKGVKNAFVWLASDPTTASGKDLPIHPSLNQLASPNVEIDQPRCGFIPHAVAVREGQTLVVKNSSPVTHNVRWEPANTIKNKGDNQTISSGKSVEIPNLKQDRYPMTIACSIHPWMKCYVRMFDSPYFAVTGDDGRFEIKLAPVGKYRLFVWHEGCGWKGGADGKRGDAIDIKPGESVDLGAMKIKP